MKKQNLAVTRRRFERIVILLDITVILRRNCTLSAAHVFNSVWRILEQCNEHNKFSTMWGYKLFDPFFAPLASRRKIGEFLGGTPMSAQFDAASPNLERFGKLLDFLVTTSREYTCGTGSRAEYIGRALNEIISEYTWDPLLASDSSSSDEERRKRGPLASMPLRGEAAKRDSNIILLFSSVPSTWDEVTCFLSSPQSIGSSDASTVPGQLKRSFRPVQDALKSRNIQVCFIDVPPCEDLWSEARLQTLLNPTVSRRSMLIGLSNLIRNFIALDLLLTSPTVLPCNLVWNMMVDLGFQESGEKIKVHVQFNNCEQDVPTVLCEAEMQRLNVLPTPSISREGSSPTSTLLSGAECVDIVLESVFSSSSLKGKFTSERFLVRQNNSPSTSSSCGYGDPLGHKILQLLQKSPTALPLEQPAWQVLLLTLACEKSVCEVSLRDHKNYKCCTAVLEPFTSDSAILTLVEGRIMPANTDIRDSVPELASPQCSEDMAQNAKHAVATILGPRKRKRGVNEAGKNLEEWDAYYQGDRKQSERISWEEYFTRIQLSTLNEFLESDGGTLLSRYISGGKASDLLETMNTFLREKKRQLRSKVGSVELHPARCLAVPEEASKAPMDLDLDPAGQASVLTTVLTDPLSVVGLVTAGQASVLTTVADSSIGSVVSHVVLGQTIDALIVDECSGASAVVRDDSKDLAEISLEEDPAAAASYWAPLTDGEMTSQEATEFLSSVEQKVIDYLSSTDVVDAQKFAGLLVTETQSALCVLSKSPTDDKGSVAGEDPIANLHKTIAGHLQRRLLKSPKRLAADYKDRGNEKIKEHELQILLRLEMISFDDGRLLEQPRKHQLVQDICKLLDSIQFHLDGGIFGEGLLGYCSRVLLVNRYTQSIPSTIAEIFKKMEIGGFSELLETNCSLQAAVSNLPAAGLFSSLEVDGTEGVGGSPDNASQQGLLRAQGSVSSSNRGTEKGSVSSSTRGTENLCLKTMVGKITKKDSFHFVAQASKLRRLRKFKSCEKSKHSKSVKVPGKRRVLASDSTVQIVCQTPVPGASFMPHSYHGADKMTQPATSTLTELKACSTLLREGAKVERSPLVVERTPFAGKRLTSHNFSEGNLSGSTNALDEPVAQVSQIFNAVPDTTAARPSKIRPRLFASESPGKPAQVRDSADLKHVIDGSFSASLKNVEIAPSKMEEAKKSKSYLGRHLFRDNDDDDDDDEDGILSTPFKVSVADESLPSFHSIPLKRPNCHKQLGMPCDGDIANICTELPQLPTVTSVSQGTAVVLVTDMGRRDTPEDAQLLEHGCRSGRDPETLPTSHQKFSGLNYLLTDESCEMPTEGSVHSLAAVPQQSPLGTICVNSAPRADMKQYSAMELSPKLDTADANNSTAGNNKENVIASEAADKEESVLDMPQKGCSKPNTNFRRVGVTQRRKTRSQTHSELTTCGPLLIVRSRKGRFP